jgi:hypothetical protein
MAFTHTSRTGKTYYLHTGSKRGGGIQHYFSTKATGSLVECVPPGFGVYETVNGQVYLRRQQPKLITDDELGSIRRQIEQPRQGHRFKVEVLGKVMTIHESGNNLESLRSFAPHLSVRQHEAIEEQLAHYQPVLRFTLVDDDKRLFAPERFCFRGSVDDWIPIGPPGSLRKLAGAFLKHLGQESFYELL